MKTDTDIHLFEEAFNRLEPRLLQIPENELRTVYVRVRDCAVAVLGISEQAMGPEWRPKFEALATSGLWSIEPLDDLESAARALYYTRMMLDRTEKVVSGAKLDPAAWREAMELRGTMRMVCEYHFSDDPQMLAELAYLRAGMGFEDLASDLLGYADIYRDHSKELKEAGKHYRTDDVKRARELAETILQSLGDRGANDATKWRELQTRAFTFMVECYNEVRGAGVFLGRRESATDKLFPPLAAIGRRSRRRSGDSDPDDPSVADPLE